MSEFNKVPLLLALVVAVVSAEAPLKSGPYPAAGYRPSKSFGLPNEQVPENIFEQEQQQQQQDEFPQTADFEVSKERVDFVRQIQGNTLLPANQPQSSYLPPSNKDQENNSQDEEDAFVLGQGLPGLARPKFFNEQQQVFSRPQQPSFRPQTQQNFRPQTPQQQQQQNFRPALQARQKNVRSQTRLQQQHQNFRPSFQARQTNFRSQTQPQQQQPNFRPQTQQNFNSQEQQQQTNFKPETQLQQNFNFQEQQQQQPHQQQQYTTSFSQTQEQNFNQPQGNQQQGQGFFSASQSSFGKPARQYGAPGFSTGQINIVYPDPRTLENYEEPNYTAIEALNAAVDAYNQAQSKKKGTDSGRPDGFEEEEEANDSDYPTTTETTTSMAATTGYSVNRTPTRSQQGQYYILGSGNELQRVMFTTSQDAQEAKTNGFTAQLKYSPAGEIRDPLFKYNERGQLVRILK